MDKTVMAHLQNEYYSSVKEKEILPFATAFISLENTMPREISQAEKDKYHMISLICGIQWPKGTNKRKRDRVIDREQADTYQGRGGAID